MDPAAQCSAPLLAKHLRNGPRGVTKRRNGMKNGRFKGDEKQMRPLELIP